MILSRSFPDYFSVYRTEVEQIGREKAGRQAIRNREVYSYGFRSLMRLTTNSGVQAVEELIIKGKTTRGLHYVCHIWICILQNPDGIQGIRIFSPYRAERGRVI